MRVYIQSPTRLSLFGGGTDTNPYASTYGGICINMAINIYQRGILDTKDKTKKYVKSANLRFYESFFESFDYKGGFIQEFDNNIHSGIGSSASIAVGLLKGLSRIYNVDYTRTEIAKEAQSIEVDQLKLYGGLQDQLACSHGGMNIFRFRRYNTTKEPIDRKTAEHISRHILLVDTDIKRTDPKLQENMKDLTPNRKKALDKIKDIAQTSINYIHNGDIGMLGSLLDLSWQAKKQSNSVTNKDIDKYYEIAKDNGALGGKVCGSGGGGYMLFIAYPEDHKRIVNKLKLRHVDFSIDFNGVMARIL